MTDNLLELDSRDTFSDVVFELVCTGMFLSPLSVRARVLDDNFCPSVVL